MALLNFTPFYFIVVLCYSLFFTLQFCFDSLELIWIVIEILTFLLIGLIFIQGYTSRSILGAVVYFITQSIFSMVLLRLLFLFRGSSIDDFFLSFGVLSVVFIKLGSFPFHSWYYSSVYSFPSFLLVLSLTFHKTSLLYIVNVFLQLSGDLVTVTYIFIVLMLLNILLLGSASLSCTDVRSLLITTSLANNSWLLLTSFSNLRVTLLFTTVYFFFLSFSLYGGLYLSTFSLVTLRGLPPLPIFFIKILTLWAVITNALSTPNMFLFLCLVILFTLLVAISYLRFTFSRFIII